MSAPPSTGELLAHGVGGRSDLPVPANLVFIAAGLALLVSFAVLALAWRTPRFRGDASGHPLPSWLAAVIDSRVTRPVVVAAGLLFAAWVTMAALFGSDTLVNPIFGTVYVLLWVGLVPAALLFGRVYRLCNPLRWLHRGVCKLAATDPSRRLGVSGRTRALAGGWVSVRVRLARAGAPGDDTRPLGHQAVVRAGGGTANAGSGGVRRHLV